MAASAGLPISIPYDEDKSVLLLSDSEDDETPPLRQTSMAPGAARQNGPVRRKANEPDPNVPLHPIPAMQNAFAESLAEATNTEAPPKPTLRFGDPKERRGNLLDSAVDAKLYNDLWRYRPGHEYHELWKLMSQISFGVYLLLHGIANSNEQVVSILQGHIDEVDEFLETSIEDVDAAVDDLKERIDFLQLPMSNVATFEKMLEDRDFRLQIVTGNEKIEHIISRSTAALEATLDDIDEGLKATKQFSNYLDDQRDGSWRQERPDVVEIFDAMQGNADGWWKAFMDLQDSTSNLDNLIIKLGHIVAEMDQRAGEVSRRTRFSVAPYSEPSVHSRSKESSVNSRHQSVASHRQSMTSRQQLTVSRHLSTAKSVPNLRRSGTPPASPPRSTGSERDIGPGRKNDVERDPLPGFQVHLAEEVVVDSDLDSDDLDSDLDSLNDSLGNESPRITSVKLGMMPEGLDMITESAEPPSAGRPDREPEKAQEPEPDLGLYILQPRTYTPQPPAPIPSPRVQSPRESTQARSPHDSALLQSPPESGQLRSPRVSSQQASPRVSQRGSPRISQSPRMSQRESPHLSQRESSRMSSARASPRVSNQLQTPRESTRYSSDPLRPQSARQSTRDDLPLRRGSLRQRVSSKGGSTPQQIHVPTRETPELRRPSLHEARATFPGPEATYNGNSNGEGRRDVHSTGSPMAELSPPSFLNPVPSPRSDHNNYFRPVQASPHSPLQRPWTSGTAAAPPSRAPPTPRYQPSTMNMSMANGGQGVSPSVAGTQEDKSLRKKKSAFGWFKKAFQLDEEERAEFEARKHQYQPNLYYETRSPKYLDGRRREEYRRY